MAFPADETGRSSMRVDPRTQLIWTVRGILHPGGHVAITAEPLVDPAVDPVRRAAVIAAINCFEGHRWPWADDRGLLAHTRQQLTSEPPQVVVTWSQVWELIRPGITPERVAGLAKAWAYHHDAKTTLGLDQALHEAMCAFYRPAPAAVAVQLDLFDHLTP